MLIKLDGKGDTILFKEKLCGDLNIVLRFLRGVLAVRGVNYL